MNNRPKLLPAARSLSFGEPLRLSRQGRYSGVVSDTWPSDLDNRLGYGGSLIAESIPDSEIGQRIVDAVNFLGGMHLPEGSVYVGAARDMLEVIAGLYAVSAEPRGFVPRNSYNSAWWAAREILKMHGLDPDELRRAAGQYDTPF